jgi:hypothetical protein
MMYEYLDGLGKVPFSELVGPPPIRGTYVTEHVAHKAYNHFAKFCDGVTFPVTAYAWADWAHGTDIPSNTAVRTYWAPWGRKTTACPQRTFGNGEINTTWTDNGNYWMAPPRDIPITMLRNWRSVRRTGLRMMSEDGTSIIDWS